MEKEKNTINKIKGSTKIFWNKNKDKIIFLGRCCIIVAGTILIFDDVNQRKYAKELPSLKKDNIELLKELRNQKNENNYLRMQNIAVTKMNENKDNFFKRFISEGTRRGDSECARQLAYRKQYLKEIS